MSYEALGIQHKTLEPVLAAMVRRNPKTRADLRDAFDELAARVPPDAVAGPAFCVFWFVTSVQEGFDVEIGVPLSRPVAGDGLTVKRLPGIEVLSLVHRGTPEELRDVYRMLYGFASEHALISDEFCREVYLDDAGAIELQFVIHNWNALLAANVRRILGSDVERDVMEGAAALTLDATLEERFRWVKAALQKLEGYASGAQPYDILSGCAHVYPAAQLAKLRSVYLEARTVSAGPLEAVDAVIAFMDRDPGWPEGACREGNILYSSKNPRDPAGHEKAETPEEKRRAYCYCPLVRDHLDEGMPALFCYCGAGWFRQQWESALGKPVAVEIVTSVLKGDDVCRFAIRLPEDL
ncbi:MAG: GyrI-like domain-containing protein [Anaerolineae bacterium]|nr:GyrI-like domain-containing protein [Anaerolineae bacterium]